MGPRLGPRGWRTLGLFGCKGVFSALFLEMYFERRGKGEGEKCTLLCVQSLWRSLIP